MAELRHFDLIVVGTGPAGTLIATQLAQRGKRVAIAEDRGLGGTCALRGCNPKKVLTNAAALIEQIHNATYLSNGAGAIHLDWPTLHKFQQQFVTPVPQLRREKYAKSGVHVIEGQAKFVGPNEVDIAGERYSADSFAIAAGAVPAPLDFPGDNHVLTSDDFLNLEDIPQHVVFLGGGYISLEFAIVVAACRKSVTIIDRHDHVLKGFDPTLVGLLTEHLKQRGIDSKLNDEIASVQQSEDSKLQVQTKSGLSIACDMVIHGAGRVPNVEPMNLSAANIDFDKTGIFVDAYLRSRSNPSVCVAGDCVAGETAKLTPTAEYHAQIVAKNLASEHPTNRRGEVVIPAVAFTVPCLASVGISEQKAREEGRQVSIRYEDDSTKGNVRKALYAVAAHKIIVDAATDRILGAHLLGPAAQETINLFALAMQHNITATQLKSMHYGYPTFSADLRSIL